MSSTRLIEFRNGIPEDYTEYSNSWGGAARVWDSIWEKYGTNLTQWDNWMTAARDGRLWNLWSECSFLKTEEMVYLFTCDDVLVENKDFKDLAVALREFAEMNPVKGVCHLRSWADLIESSTAEAIGLHATTVTENPWCKWDEKKDEPVPYNFKKGKKHEWLSDLMNQSPENE